MVILGLGSNLGDRLAHLRKALHLIQAIPTLSILQVSALYLSDALLPDNAPTSWDTPYLNLALRCDTSLAPLALLAVTKEIEITLGRAPGKHWGPRPVDIDILAWDDLTQYDEKLHIPHEHLTTRPFALWPLADVAPFWVHPVLKKTAVELASSWGSRFDGAAPLHTQQIQQRIDTPQLVSIINLTPASFSNDGGHFLEPDQLVAKGADVLDIGAEATNPRATPISADQEWQHLEPILHRVLDQRAQWILPAKISVDTRHVTVAEKALALGVDWINDVSGLEDPAMRELLSHSSADVIFMHHLGIPARDNHIPLDQDPILSVYQWATERLDTIIQSGIAKERIIFDAGIGFGKTAEQSLALIKHISFFKQLGLRLLVGHSRKRFQMQFTTHPAHERDIETIPLSLYLAKQQVDYLRIHNVDAHARTFKILSTLL